MRQYRFCLFALSCVIGFASGCNTKGPITPPDVSKPGRLEFSPSQITLREVSPTDPRSEKEVTYFELQDESLTFTDEEGRTWTAPKGTWTDGASVPRFALAITDGRFDQRFLKAAVIHDAYCQRINESRASGQYRQERWEDVHKMFYDACKAGNTPEKRAKSMYAAVLVRGPRWGTRATIFHKSYDAALLAFSGVENWIKKDNPSPKEIIAYVEKREPPLEDPSALNGMGSVSYMRGDDVLAETYVRSALQVAPEYSHAKEDLEAILESRKSNPN